MESLTNFQKCQTPGSGNEAGSVTVGLPDGLRNERLFILELGAVVRELNDCGFHDAVNVIDDLVKQRDAAEEMAARAGWRPIETGPKDGTPMLLCHWESPTQDVLPIASGFWSRLSECWFAELIGKKIIPTHWMPLPAPPTEGEG